MSEQPGITEFIEARLAELEARAKAAAEVPNGDVMLAALPTPLFDGMRAAFPAYVLADIAAKRRILAEHALVESDDWKAQQKGEWSTPEALQYGCRRCDDEDGYIYGTNGCRTIRLLAAPFSSREAFNSDWSLP